jgi:hypothetical protein
MEHFDKRRFTSQYESSNECRDATFNERRNASCEKHQDASRDEGHDENSFKACTIRRKQVIIVILVHRKFLKIVLFCASPQVNGVVFRP